tara:strand:- start:2716 stop:3396 length:681 start_codon:yes stop_codon:yes gene_type:complete
MSRLSVAILGDLHAPFHCRKSVYKVISIIRKEKPKIVIQIGDLLDLYAFSKFPKSLNVMGPAQEVKQGRKVTEDLWKEIRQAAGRQVECFQLLGNHDERLAKRIQESLPEVEGMAGTGLWSFPGVQTMEAERDELIIDGVVYMHGYRKFGDHVKYNLMSTVCGHSHQGGVVYLPIKGKTLFELNAGYLGDPKATAMTYTKQSKISRWTKGVGWIDDYGPRFIPLGG